MDSSRVDKVKASYVGFLGLRVLYYCKVYSGWVIEYWVQGLRFRM